MKAITLVVNGQRVSGIVEPRQHLADFLREYLGLTGTHLGCEQGVCGACTIMIDGKPSRSCITYAIACEGADVRTIEDFDNDVLMSALRDSFAAHHGLQCGFCTPGMLITSRDVVQRLGEVDERILREELSGNLCRCTGYIGIVAAVKDVARGRQPNPATELDALPPSSTPPSSTDVPAATPSEITLALAVSAPSVATNGMSPASAGPRVVPLSGPSVGLGAWTTLEQQVDIDAEPAAVWEALHDVRRIAGCLPGATVDHVEGSSLSGHMTIRFGPIKTRFHGEGTISLDEAERSGKISGAGRETGGSQATGEVSYRVAAGAADGTTRLNVALRYQLTGALAQFSRGALVQDFVRRMTEIFAANLAASLDNRAAPPLRAAEMNMVSMVIGVFWRRIKTIFRSGKEPMQQG